MSSYRDHRGALTAKCAAVKLNRLPLVLARWNCQRVVTIRSVPVPRYDYRCESCKEEFELVQTFAEAGKGTCPKCSGPGQRVYHAVPVIYKGSGFYTTDYGRPSPPVENKSTDISSPTDSKPSNDSNSSSDTKSVTASNSSGDNSPTPSSEPSSPSSTPATPS